VMRVNPLTYGMAALREGLYFAHPASLGAAPGFALTIPVSIAFAAFAFILAARVARRNLVF
ncbi:MAG: ABC transporter permease, partial [Candidatus Binataceae bacterium]